MSVEPAQPSDIVRAALDAYLDGWFPMHDAEMGITQWVQPEARALIPLDDRFRVPRTTRQAIARARFRITIDHAFPDVIRACWKQERDGAWLHDNIVALFDHLHAAGFAHSVEAWIETENSRTLVGGLYGLALGRVFAGESMFSRPDLGGTEASKVCLVALVNELRARQFVALDSQLYNPHLEQFGLFEVAREDYLAMLAPQRELLAPGTWRTPG